MRIDKKNRNILLIVLAALTVTLVLSLIFGAESLDGHAEDAFPVYINEIMASNSTYPNADGVLCDWIELHNSSAAAVDIGGYKLTDNTDMVRFAFPGGTVLGPGEYIVVSCNAVGENALYANFGISKSGGETIYFMSKKSAVLSSVETITADKNTPQVRLADGSWALGSVATPGFENSDEGYALYLQSLGVDAPRVVISEILASNSLYPVEGMLCDWVEICNADSVPADISGFGLSDDADTIRWHFPEGTVLQPGEYLVVPCSAEYAAAAPFGLSRMGGEVVSLFTASGAVLDRVTTLGGHENLSMIRGEGGVWSECAYATPGFPNTDAGYETYLASVGAFDYTVCISEAMADNGATIYDSAAGFADWVELWNYGSEAVSLEGCFLSDDPAAPLKYALPDVTLQPDEYLLVWCGDGVGGLYTGFGIAAEETVVLSSASGNAIDEMPMAGSGEDVSLCRSADGSLTATMNATPGYPNTSEGRAAFCASLLCNSPIRINEVSISNFAHLKQTNGEYYDWVELKNVSNQPVSLSGWSVYDKFDPSAAVPLPDVTLAPGQTWTFLCTGESGISGVYSPYVPFALNAESDRLYLFHEGELLDYGVFFDVPYGGTMGRMDSANGWFYFETPTPGADNAGGSRGVSAEPLCLTEEGLYEGITGLTVTLEGGGNIHYTTDGRVPTQSDPLYTGPFEISATTVVRAVSFESGKLPSAPLTASFLINEGHTLPVISLVAEPDDLWSPEKGIYVKGNYVNYYQDWEKYASVSMFEQDGGSFTLDCGLTMYGAGSRETEQKKSFKLQFRPRYDGALDYDVFDTGVTDYASLVLRAGEDSSRGLFREEIFTMLANEDCPTVMTQKSQFTALYINGEFFGVYCLKEAFSEEYYATHWDVDPASVTLATVSNVGRTELFSLMNYARTHSMTVPENYAYVKSRIDFTSLIDWSIFQCYGGNVDIAGNIRYFCSTEGDTLWRWALYDMDWAFTSHSNSFTTIMEGGQQHSILVRALLKNDEFRAMYTERLDELLATTLSDENVLAHVDYLYNLVYPEMPREREQWNVSMEIWEYYVNYTRNFIKGRAAETRDGYTRLLNELGIWE